MLRKYSIGILAASKCASGKMGGTVNPSFASTDSRQTKSWTDPEDLGVLSGCQFAA